MTKDEIRIILIISMIVNVEVALKANGVDTGWQEIAAILVAILIIVLDVSIGKYRQR